MIFNDTTKLISSAFSIPFLLLLLSVQGSEVPHANPQLHSQDSMMTKFKNFVARPFIPIATKFAKPHIPNTIQPLLEGMRFSDGPKRIELNMNEFENWAASQRIQSAEGFPSIHTIDRIVLKPKGKDNRPAKLYVYSSGDEKTTFHVVNDGFNGNRLVDVKKKVTEEKNGETYQIVSYKNQKGKYEDDHIIKKFKDEVDIFGKTHEVELKLKGKFLPGSKDYLAVEAAKVKGPFGLRYRPVKDGKRIGIVVNPTDRNIETLVRKGTLGPAESRSRLLKPTRYYDSNGYQRELPQNPDVSYYILAGSDTERSDMKGFLHNKPTLARLYQNFQATMGAFMSRHSKNQE